MGIDIDNATAPSERFDWTVQMVYRAVLDPGESPQRQRAVQAVGPWQVGLYRSTWESNPDALASFPGGKEWLEKIATARPESERHLFERLPAATSDAKIDALLPQHIDRDAIKPR